MGGGLKMRLRSCSEIVIYNLCDINFISINSGCYCFILRELFGKYRMMLKSFQAEGISP